MPAVIAMAVAAGALASRSLSGWRVGCARRPSCDSQWYHHREDSSDVTMHACEQKRSSPAFHGGRDQHSVNTRRPAINYRLPDGDDEVQPVVALLVRSEVMRALNALVKYCRWQMPVMVTNDRAYYPDTIVVTGLGDSTRSP